MIRTLLVLLTLLVPTISHAALSDVITIQEFTQSGEQIKPEEGRRVYSVDIDSRIKVHIDKAKLAQAIPQPVLGDDPKIATLKELLIQARLLRDSYLLLANDIATKPLSELQQDTKVKSYLESAGKFMAAVRSVAKGELKQRIDSGYNELFSKYTGRNERKYLRRYIYDLLYEVLADELDSLASRIEKRKVSLPSYKFSLVGYHYSVGGGASNIAIPPYTTGKHCAPTPAKRFDLKPNAMTQKEMEAVQAALPLAQDFASGKAKDNFKQLVRDIRVELVKVKDQFNDDKLLAILNDIKDDVEHTVSDDKKKVLDSIEFAKSLAATIKDITTLSNAPLDQQVLSRVDQIDQLFNETSGQIASLKKALNDLRKLLPKVANAVSQDLRNKFNDEVKKLRGNLDFGKIKNNELVIQIQSLAPIVKGLKTVQTSVEKLVVLSVPVSRVADVEIDLQSLCGERKRGDIIKFEAALYSPGESDAAIESIPLSVQLEMVGLYAEPHGYLAFVDPRKTVDTTQNYMAAPALGFYLYSGARDWRFYNELLKPGIGISLSALDFDQNKDLEIGIAIGVVLFQDTIHLGYGRNLQAKANYIYFGLNPLAIWELSQSRSMAP